MAWFHVTDGRLRYHGRVTRRPFAAWTTTRDGAAAMTGAAGRLRVPVLRRTRAVRRIWRELNRVCRTDTFRALADAEAARFMAAFADVAYAPSLPRRQCGLRRVVIVPRTMVGSRAPRAILDRLNAAPALAALEPSVRTFLCEHLIREMAAALVRSKPSPRHPVLAREGWVLVGLDDRFVWVDPLWCGRDWLGHAVMFEMPPAGLSRRDRKDLEDAVRHLESGLPLMTRIQRDGTVRAAASSLQPA
jgi:hypothetical protein